MADILDIFNNTIPLTDNILWQYDNAPNLKSLINSKQNWYNTNTTEFFQGIIDNFLNINSANDWGLTLWGIVLQVPRNYVLNGEEIILSTDLYKRLILGKLQLIYSNGTVPEIMSYCNFVFSNRVIADEPAVFVKDNLDMTISYTFTFSPTPEELALIYSRELLPTPAGVEENLIIIPVDDVFGFDGSGLQPFNQAPFWSN